MESIKKYQDEPWRTCIERLKDKIGAGDDKKGFMKMEQEDLPRDIKIILLSSNTGSIDELIDRIRKLEEYEVQVEKVKRSNNLKKFKNDLNHYMRNDRIRLTDINHSF